MGLGRRSIGLAVAGTASVLGAAQAVAAVDDDVPKREPVLAWESSVECDSGADLVAAGGQGRHCALAFARDAVYVHQHTGMIGGGGPFRLSALDVATGDVRWSQEVGETFEIRLTDEVVILSDKAHVEVFDAETGDPRFMRDGGLINYNRYGVLVMDAGSESIAAIDAADGDELWSMPGRVGAMCRDFVAVVPARSQPAAPFALVDHRSGDVRWESEVDFDPETSDMACSGAPWIYVTDGDRLYELDSLDGWTTWETAVPGATAVDLYREVALVRTGSAGDTTTAVRREDGAVLWQAPTGDVGASLSWTGRLREDAAGLFTLHPLTGETVQRVDLSSPGSAFEVVGLSDTRVVVAVDSTITAFGMNDLGMAWQIDAGNKPDDFGVTNGHLVVRHADRLQAYTAPPRSAAG